MKNVDLAKPFRRKDKGRLYFMVAVSDRPTDGFQLIPDKDCVMFIVNGETSPKHVIPPTVLKEIVERFSKPTEILKVSEKKV